MYRCTLPDHLLVDLKLVKKENYFDDLGTLITGDSIEEEFKGTFQYMEKEILIRSYGIDIETKVYKLVTRKHLEVRNIITYRGDSYEIIENRNSIYTNAQVYLVKNIEGGKNV